MMISDIAGIKQATGLQDLVLAAGDVFCLQACKMCCPSKERTLLV